MQTLARHSHAGRQRVKKRKRFNKIDGQFSARTIEMMESPSFRLLSLSARRILDRIEIEHAHHGGQENGKLIVTYDDFQRYGIERHSIRPAINELAACGFIRISEQGFSHGGDLRAPNRFRLTYRAAHDGAPATNDWKAIRTDEDAAAIIRAARQKPDRRKQSASVESSPRPVGISPLKIAVF